MKRVSGKRVHLKRRSFSRVTPLICSVVVLAALLLATLTANTSAEAAGTQGQNPAYSVEQSESTIDMSQVFTASGNPVSAVKATANSISVGWNNSTEVSTQYSGYQLGALTSDFSINWLRPFVLQGTMTTSNTFDQSMIGFHTDKGRTLKANGTAAGYSAGYTWATALASPGLENSVSWYFNHAVNGSHCFGTTSRATSRDVGMVYWDSGGFPAWWDTTKSGINAGTWNSSTLKQGNDNGALFGTTQNFMIRWELDASGTTGTLTFSFGGQSRSVSGINPVTLFGSEDKAQNTYFEISTSLYNQAANKKNFAASLTDFRYTDLDLVNVNTTVERSVVRDGQTVVYDPTDQSTWPKAGETITVTYTLKNNMAQSRDIKVPMRLLMQMEDATRDVTSSGGSESATLTIDGVSASYDIYNNATSSDSKLYNTCYLTF